MESVDILVVVLSCKKNQHLWPKILGRNVLNLIILCGGSEETKLEENILYLKCNDAYDGLSEKIMTAYDYILNSNKFKFTHILKADDHDTEFTSEQICNIQDKFKDILKSNHYIGQNLLPPSRLGRTHHFNKVPSSSPWYNKSFDGPAISYLGGGETYILSKYSMNLIINNKDDFHNYGGLEDVMIGSILLKYDIHPYKLDYGIKTWIG
jgi:hypothetical protein